MAAAPITYVRHAMPAVEDGVNPADWHLDDATRLHVRAWADRLEVGEGIGALIAAASRRRSRPPRRSPSAGRPPIVTDDRAAGGHPAVDRHRLPGDGPPLPAR